MRKELKDMWLKSLKAPATGRTEVVDMRCAGLAFRITAAGSCSWSFRFRDPRTGKVTRSTIGTYPEITLTDARTKANDLRKSVAKGVNPVEEKRKARVEANDKVFSVVAKRFLEEHSRRKKRSADADDRNLRLHVLPKWKDRIIDAIERRDVITLTEGLMKAGKPSLANKCQALISTIFSFAVDADLVKANPCSRLRKRGTETAGTRILSDIEIPLFWRRSVLPPVSRSVGLALRLTLLTAARADEAAGLSHAELEYLDDPERAAWILPSGRSKNRRPHYVPLSRMAVATIKSAIELTPDGAEYIFPSRVQRGGPINGHALAVAMRRLSEKIDGDGSKTWKVAPPTPQDLRRTVSTRLASLGIPQEDVSAALNHVRQDVTGKHYDLYKRAKEKRLALNLWATSVATMIP